MPRSGSGEHLKREDRLPLVVLVEDNADDEQMVRRALRRASFAHPLIVVDDVRHAPAAIREHAANGRLALVLLDLYLPVLKGTEILEEIRSDEASRLVPVVVYTTSYAPSDIEKCYEAGANGFIHKPIDALEHQDVLEETLRYWLGLNQCVLWPTASS
jgi:two-component system, response regulator